ncbi:hypothetical protein ACFFGH_15115 [Lysobacter korlensis]|uniref:Uncharacterized protein n=1 Tax=Lysobacter korlensis TaxID=553636 RepID=A0ABV6RRZ6_9GAMM
MTRPLLTLACLGALVLTACNREAPVAEPAVETPAPAAAPQTDAIDAVATPTPSVEAPAAFDQKAFAGVFTAGANRLELKPDGTYAMAANGSNMDGTWTAEENDTRIRLDPNSKTEPDRVFVMTGRDQLSAVGADGQPAAGADAMALTRETPAAAQ